MMKRTLSLATLSLSLVLAAPTPASACGGSYEVQNETWALEQSAAAAFDEEGAWADGGAASSFGAFSRVPILGAEGERLGTVYLAHVAPFRWDVLWVSRA
jgi:hypothetical protein